MATLIDKLYFTQNSIIAAKAVKDLKERRDELYNDWCQFRGIYLYFGMSIEELDKRYLSRYVKMMEEESELRWQLYNTLLKGELRHPNKLRVMEHENQKFDIDLANYKQSLMD